MAKKNQLNVSVGVDTKGYKGSWDEAIKITQGAGADIEKQAAKMALAVAKKIEGMSIKAQARQLENLTAKMAEAGLQGTKAFTMAASSAGKLKAEIDDAKGIVAAFRPDAPFNALTTALQGGAQAFAGVQGAMALFGAESEETQKMLLKVQAAMAFAEGFKALDTLSDGMTQIGLIVNGKAIPAIKSFVASMSATKIAIASTGIGVLVVALGYLATSFDDVEKEAEKTKEQIDAVSDSINQLFGITDHYNKLAILHAKTRGATETEIYKLERNGLLNKIEILEGNIQIEKDKTKLLEEQTKYRHELQILDAEFELKQADEKRQRDKENGDKSTKAAKDLADRLNEIERSKIIVIDEAREALSKYNTEREKWAGLSGGDFNQTPDAPKPMSGMQSDLTKGMDTLTLSTQKQTQAWLANEDAIAKNNLAMEKAKVASAEIASLNQNIESSLESMISSMAEAIGKGENPMDAFLLSFAQGLESLGKLLIAQGVAFAAIQSSFDPAVKIAAGIAAVAIGAAIQVKMSESQTKGFASGGLIPGNSFTGDRLLAPVNSGEVVLNTGQQNALLRMANGGGGGGQLTTRFDGRDLWLMMKKAERDYGRG